MEILLDKQIVFRLMSLMLTAPLITHQEATVTNMSRVFIQKLEACETKKRTVLSGRHSYWIILQNNFMTLNISAGDHNSAHAISSLHSPGVTSRSILNRIL